LPPDTATLPPRAAAPAAAPPAASQLADPAFGIQGAVDNVGAEKIYGWAWHPARPDDRLQIEARLAGRTAVTARADFARPDLAKFGIGDGNHAFELRLTRECVQRKAELSIVAVAGDGTEKALTFRIKRTPAIAAAETRRDVQALAVEQRELRDEMRAAITRLARAPRGGDAAAAGQVATVQAKLEERLGTLDLWLTRLDGRLAALAEAQATAAPRRRIDPWQVALGVVLALSAGAGLGVAVLLLAPGALG
jgi:hypothetical protein